MKSILCYGDSNTWGYNPENGTRYPADIRWPGILQKELGTDYEVIENGIGGRSSVWDNPFFPGHNGKEGLIYALLSARPIDLMIIMLGTNDLKYNDAFNVAKGQQTLIRAIKGYQQSVKLITPIFTTNEPQLLLVSPPLLGESLGSRHTIEPYLNREESKKLAEYYCAVAKEEHCFFLDAAEFATASQLDGMHLPVSEHSKLGMAICEKVRMILNLEKTNI